MISTFKVAIDSIAEELSTRPVGAKTRRILLRLIDQYESIEIDFKNKTVTPSFADESIGMLAGELGLEDFKRRVTLLNVVDSNKPLIKHVVLKRCSQNHAHAIA